MTKEARVWNENPRKSASKQRRRPCGYLVGAKATKDSISINNRDEISPSHIPEIRMGLECPNRF